jgi:hypothetical protein
MVRRLGKRIVEEAVLPWLESSGYAVKHGPKIAPCESAAERQDYGRVVLEDRLPQSLVRLNPALPAVAFAALCDTLLPKLLSGTIRVENSRQLVEGVSP